MDAFRYTGQRKTVGEDSVQSFVMAWGDMGRQWGKILDSLFSWHGGTGEDSEGRFWKVFCDGMKGQKETVREDSGQSFVVAWRNVSAAIDTCCWRSRVVEIHDRTRHSDGHEMMMMGIWCY